MVTILPFARPAAPPAPTLPPVLRQVVTGETATAMARDMVATAMTSWMQGDPLTAREQRIVDLVLDTNYFGQLGRLAMGS